MDFIIKPRSFGKTFELIQIANASQRPILVATEASKTRIKLMCHKYGYDITVYSVKDIKEEKALDTNQKDFLIDEADAVLKALLSNYNINPIIGTLTIGGK